jgi:hypothetical protein
VNGILVAGGIRGEQLDCAVQGTVRDRLTRAVGAAELVVREQLQLPAEDALVEGQRLGGVPGKNRYGTSPLIPRG